MIKLKNNPKKLLSVGFVGIRFKLDYTDPRVDSVKEPTNWLLGLLDKDDYYAEHAGVIFVRVDGIESLLMIKYPNNVEKIYKDKRDWDK